MMSEDSKPKVDMDSLPETFTERFKCNKCKKYLRPPIWIICNSGHNVCDICKTDAGIFFVCPGFGFLGCEVIPGNIRNFAYEDMRKVCPMDSYFKMYN